MKILSNVHTHSLYCDGKVSPKKMVEAAMDLSFVSLGFSGHSPLPYENSYAMSIEGEEEYKKEIRALKEEYRGSLEILLGIEWDLDSRTPVEDYDYRIGSVHQLHGKSRVYAVDYTEEELNSCLKKVFKGNWRAMVEKYYTLVIENALRPSVDILGHFDLITKLNHGNTFFPEESKEYREIALWALREILRKRPELVLEINTGAMYRVGKKVPYPAPFLLETLGSLGARVIITSDAHGTEALDYGFSEALKLSVDNGIKEICLLREKGFVPISSTRV